MSNNVTRNQVISDCSDAVASIPYTEIDGHPFVLRDEAMEAVRALMDDSKVKSHSHIEREIRNKIAEEIAREHLRATYDPHSRDEECEDCSIWYRAYDIAKGVRNE